MFKKELIKIGITNNRILKEVIKAAKKAKNSGKKAEDILDTLHRLRENPESFIRHKIYKKAARFLLSQEKIKEPITLKKEPVPYKIWGSDIEDGALRQMNNACMLPIAFKGALMPDAHLGYGLPIGGVLATENAIIPYAVGMDIACRMKLSVLDIGLDSFQNHRDRFSLAINKGTRFGVGSEYQRQKDRKKHSVMDMDWKFCKFITSRKDKAWKQLGTSGSGNHFAEFGNLTVKNEIKGLKPGSYLAFLTHSGSRGVGADIAKHYSKLAKSMRLGLPGFLSQLAWFNMKESEGQEYYKAMTLMGHYASANHDIIHQEIMNILGAEIIFGIENHHNFAWNEIYDDRELLVHRKGATPADRSSYGFIPGTMATEGYVIRGKGNVESLNSASHGAGRLMSRKAAKKRFCREDIHTILKQKGVELISAGLDEIPLAYKDIQSVMDAQKDLVEVMATFYPKLVKMAP